MRITAQFCVMRDRQWVHFNIFVARSCSYAKCQIKKSLLNAIQITVLRVVTWDTDRLIISLSLVCPSSSTTYAVIIKNTIVGCCGAGTQQVYVYKFLTEQTRTVVWTVPSTHWQWSSSLHFQKWCKWIYWYEVLSQRQTRYIGSCHIN